MGAVRPEHRADRRARRTACSSRWRAGEAGVGAEVRIGEGIIGVVAEARNPIRISGLIRELLYAAAVRRRTQEEGLGPALPRIPLPGLPNPQSQLGIPLLVRGELIGVLCIESETRYRFHEEDKTSIELLGSYLAIAIQNMLLQERAKTPAEIASPFRNLQRPPVSILPGQECVRVWRVGHAHRVAVVVQLRLRAQRDNAEEHHLGELRGVLER